MSYTDPYYYHSEQRLFDRQRGFLWMVVKAALRLLPFLPEGVAGWVIIDQWLAPHMAPAPKVGLALAAAFFFVLLLASFKRAISQMSAAGKTYALFLELFFIVFTTVIPVLIFYHPLVSMLERHQLPAIWAYVILLALRAYCYRCAPKL